VWSDWLLNGTLTPLKKAPDAASYNNQVCVCVCVCVRVHDSPCTGCTCFLSASFGMQSYQLHRAIHLVGTW